MWWSSGTDRVKVIATVTAAEPSALNRPNASTGVTPPVAEVPVTA